MNALKMLVALLVAAFASTSHAAGITQAQFNAMLQKSPTYKAMLTNVVALKVRLAVDESIISTLIPYATKTWYFLPDCKGSALQLVDAGGFGAETMHAGVVFRSWLDGSTWYIAPTPPNSALQSVKPFSYFANGICTTIVGGQSGTGYEAIRVTV